MTKLAPKGLACACFLFAHSIGAQQQTDLNQETQELLDELTLKIQVTVAEIQKNEVAAGNEKAPSYSIDIPAATKLDLGLELDVSDPSNGFKVLSVGQNSLANQMGIKSGDSVVTVNHFEVNDSNTEIIVSELQSLQAGDSLALMVNRENSLKQFTMTIAENPLPPATVHVGKNSFKYAENSLAPAPFQRFDNSSTKTINYDVLSQWLDYLVVDLGRSDRRSASVGRVQIVPPIGTRIAPKVNKETLFEGNRFFYEGFEKDQEARQVLKGVRDSLEQLPTNTPLEYYSRNEQLAYWLNLYNITILNEIVDVYPERDLEDLLVGEESILTKKLLTVAGVPLSLNDIQFNILNENYDNNPLLIYGLYQGIIGGPNIRKEAYNGATVYQALKSNAVEFVNSNRGTNRHNDKYKIQKVSSLYARNKSYFPDFNKDLSEHLSKYINGYGNGPAKFKKSLKPVINDWTVTDLWGTFPYLGFSGVGNSVALMGAIRGDAPFTSAPMPLAIAAGGLGVFQPQLYDYLIMLNIQRVETNKKNATVSMEELGETSVEP